MGGDDLGDDDLWLAPSVVKQQGKNLQVDDNDNDDDDEDLGEHSRKRKGGTEAEDGAVAKPSKKRMSTEQVLIQSAKDLPTQTPEEMATYLSTSLKHYGLMRPQDPPGADGDHEVAHSVEPRYFWNGTREEGSTLAQMLTKAVSLKKLKKWKHVSSPCIVVVCISARRAVDVLKDLAALKVRAAKLFPKNGTLAEQRQQLSSAIFPVAVGTPHRLHALAEADKSTQSDQAGVLTFAHTHLVVLDCFISNKDFTVLTLPDTAPECMALISRHILPHVQRRRDFKLACF